MAQKLVDDVSRLIAAYSVTNPALYLLFEGVLTDSWLENKAEAVEFLLEATKILGIPDLVPMEIYQEAMCVRGLPQYNTEGKLADPDTIVELAGKLQVFVGQAGDRKSAREYLGVLLAIKRRTT